MARLQLRGVTKRFGKVAAVDDLTLDVAEGEFVTLLGPSGCGKTTTLRIVAGFVEADAGEVLFDDQRVTYLPPNRRDTAMVFQSYALFPHMTVFGNVSFGLRMRHRPRREIQERVKEALALVGLWEYRNRYPRQLSGGQQQRVAVARAVVTRPKILLFDEPLSNLDAKLRERLRFEIRELQRKLGITSLYVTHDQAEALVLSDQIAVMNHGRLEEVGPPLELYQRPRSKFVAEFIGLTNFIPAQVAEVLVPGARYGLSSPLGKLLVSFPGKLEVGQAVTLSVRPEQIGLQPDSMPDQAENSIVATVTTRTYLGNLIEYQVAAGGFSLRVQALGGQVLEADQQVRASIPADSTVIPGS